MNEIAIAGVVSALLVTGAFLLWGVYRKYFICKTSKGLVLVPKNETEKLAGKSEHPREVLLANSCYIVIKPGCKRGHWIGRIVDMDDPKKSFATGYLANYEGKVGIKSMQSFYAFPTF